MRHSLLLLSLAALLPAQTPQATPAGHWVSNLQVFDQNNYDRLELELHGSKVTGKLGDQVFEGTFQNGQIKGTAKNLQLEGRVTSSTIKGTATNTKFKEEFRWEATREAIANSEAPKTHTFEPTEFHHFFSSAIKPALRIHPGDTVRTWSVDAGGTDAKGVRRTSGGNPLTGPFYIEGALPGDTLAIHFTKIRLNRDTAISSPLITGNALTPDYVQERKPADDYNANWQLDRNAGVAFLQKPTAALQNFKVPLAPMLGCVGVAPPGGAQFRSGYLGNFGGNMDYNLHGHRVHLGPHQRQLRTGPQNGERELSDGQRHRRQHGRSLP
jgi:amidase